MLPSYVMRYPEKSSSLKAATHSSNSFNLSLDVNPQANDGKQTYPASSSDSHLDAEFISSLGEKLWAFQSDLFCKNHVRTIAYTQSDLPTQLSYRVHTSLRRPHTAGKSTLQLIAQVPSGLSSDKARGVWIIGLWRGIQPPMQCCC